MSSALDQLFLFVLSRQQADRQEQLPHLLPAVAHTDSRHGSVPVPSPSPVYPGGGSAAAVTPTEPKQQQQQQKLFSFKPRCAAAKVSAPASVPTPPARSAVATSSAIPTLLHHLTNLSADAFIEALAIRCQYQDDSTANGVAPHSVHSATALSQRSAQFQRSFCDTSLFHKPLFESAADVGLSVASDCTQSEVESRRVVRSAMALPAFRAALFRFLVEADSATARSPFFQQLVRHAWEICRPAEEEAGARRRPRDQFDHLVDTSRCEPFARVFNSLNVDTNALRVFCSFPASSALFRRFLGEHRCGTQLCHDMIPHVLAAFAAVPSADFVLPTTAAHPRSTKLLDALVRRCLFDNASFLLQQRQQTLPAHLAASVFRGYDAETVRNRNDDVDDDDGNRTVALLLRAYRQSLVASVFPSRCLSGLRSVDAVARSKQEKADPSPSSRCCRILSAISSDSTAAEKLVDLAFACDLLGALQNDLDLLQQPQQHDKSDGSVAASAAVLQRAQTVLLFTPVYSGERQAMMNFATTAASPTVTAALTPPRILHAALATAIEILVVVVVSSSKAAAVVPEALVRQRIVDFCCRVRSVIHASSSVAPGKQCDPIAMLTALGALVAPPPSSCEQHVSVSSSSAAAPVNALLSCSSAALSSFLLQSLLAAAEVVVLVASLQEDRLAQIERADSGDIMTTSSYLSGAHQFQRFAAALLGRDEEEAAALLESGSKQMLPFGDDDDDDDNDASGKGGKDVDASAPEPLSSLAEKLLNTTGLLLSRTDRYVVATHCVRWTKTMLCSLGRADSVEAVAEYSSSTLESAGRSGEAAGEKQVALLVRLGQLLAPFLQNAANTSSAAAQLFACTVLKELLGATQFEAKTFVQCLAGDRAQMQMGRFVLHLVAKAVGGQQQQNQSSDAEDKAAIKRFLNEVAGEIVPLLHVQDSVRLKDLLR